MKNRDYTISINELSLQITEDRMTYFGGNQYWYPKKPHQLSGCGPVAAANITAYLAKKDPAKYGNLYAPNSFSKADFIEHQAKLRAYVKPGIFGLTSVDQFSTQLITYAKDCGVSLEPQMGHELQTLDEAINYIYLGLSTNTPVALLILLHPEREIAPYTWHWLTITGIYYKDSSYQNPFIVTSTCGERHLMDLDKLWNNRKKQHIVKLVYFK